MKLAVVGSRSITDYQTVATSIVVSPWSPDVIVSGGAQGVDTKAAHFADVHGLDTVTIEPDWDDWSGGHPALSRNTTIIKSADAVVAVWDGSSSGTKDSIDKALERNKPIYVNVVEQ